MPGQKQETSDTLSGGVSSLQAASYVSVSRRGESEIQIKKSRFLGVCMPIREAGDAEAALRQLRAAHPEARHIASAWLTAYPLRSGHYSDDGEPQGTAGKPILELLQKRGVEQAALFVIRYFGGILLGAGGLVRAYSEAAALALEDARPLPYFRQKRLRIVSSYALYDLLRRRLADAGFRQEAAHFALHVEWELSVEETRLPQLRRLLDEISGGKARLEVLGEHYAPLPSTGAESFPRP